MRKIFIITIFGFLAGTFMGFGSYLFGPDTDFKTVANVNGAKISMNVFNVAYSNAFSYYSQNGSLDDEQVKNLKVGIIQSLVQDEIFYQQSELYKIKVSKAELQSYISRSPMFSQNNRFSLDAYYSFLRSVRMAPKDYEELVKKQIAVQKFKSILAASVKLGDLEFEDLKAQAEAQGEKEGVAKDVLLNAKINRVLNDWYNKTVATSKITTNNSVFQ